MTSSTATCVENSTDSHVQDRIRSQVRERLARFETANQRELTYRLAELDQEWDIERALELHFSGVVLGGIAFGTLSNRKWYLLPAIAACFMIEHVMEGWCPQLIVLRRLGFRTAAEINHERTALKIMRGDFAHLGLSGNQATSQAPLIYANEE